jgi:hypothetical protein
MKREANSICSTKKKKKKKKIEVHYHSHGPNIMSKSPNDTIFFSLISSGKKEDIMNGFHI